MMTLRIPPRRDPIARIALIALFGLALYANVVSLSTPAQAQGGAAGTIIYMATPTPALPTPALAAPALGLIDPTPQTIYIEVPGPTPPPEVVYVEVSGQFTNSDQQPFVPPAIDPATQHGTPEFNAALAEIYSDLPTIQCPCGVLEPATPHVMTEAERAYSRARTR